MGKHFARGPKTFPNQTEVLRKCTGNKSCLGNTAYYYYYYYYYHHHYHHHHRRRRRRRRRRRNNNNNNNNHHRRHHRHRQHPSSSALRPFKFVLGFPHDRCPFRSVSSCCTPILPHPHSSSPIRPHPFTLIHIFLFSPSQCVLLLKNQVSYSNDRTSTAIWLYDIFPRFRRSLYKIRTL